MLKLDLSQDDLHQIDDALEVVVTIAEQEIDGLIEEDQTPETVEDFLDVVFTAQEELATLKNLQQRIQEALDGN
jgi:hypothetical protein